MKECRICKKAFPNNSKLRRHEKGKFHLKKAEKVSKATNIVTDDFVVSPRMALPFMEFQDQGYKV